jgi:hypothetical protein
MKLSLESLYLYDKIFILTCMKMYDNYYPILFVFEPHFGHIKLSCLVPQTIQ